MKIYFASPLFSQMELMYNEYLVRKIREAIPGVAIYLPQEQLEINDKNAYADSVVIAQVDTKHLLESDVLVAVIDGINIDAGVASEIGVAYQAGIPVVGLFTDSRQQGASNTKKLEALNHIGESQFAYVNLYTVGLIKLNGVLVNHEDELMKALQNYHEAI